MYAVFYTNANSWNSTQQFVLIVDTLDQAFEYCVAQKGYGIAIDWNARPLEMGKPIDGNKPSVFSRVGNDLLVNGEIWKSGYFAKNKV